MFEIIEFIIENAEEIDDYSWAWEEDVMEVDFTMKDGDEYQFFVVKEKEED